MKIQSTSINNRMQGSTILNNKKQRISFNGYSEVLHDSLQISIKNESEAENIFRTLWNELLKENNLLKNNSFNILKEIFDKNGFRGLLHELWKANPKEEVAKLLKDTEENCENLVTQNGEPLMTLYNFGKYGFWGRKTSPNDIRLVFYADNQHEMIDFHLSKKGNLKTSQSNGKNLEDNEFYMTTGTLKEKYVSSASGQQRTHYNEDGSMPIIKNIVLDGNTPQIY